MKELCCPLCESQQVQIFFTEKDQLAQYLQCGECALVFRHPSEWLSATDEKARYLYHRNSPDDVDYRTFLAQLVDPLIENLPANSSGLDFGCGPGPTISIMLEQAGHQITNYDPFFFPDESALTKRYDFITCSETAEHFHTPRLEFERLNGLLKPGGLLALMTALCPPLTQFSDWYYRRDPTHTVFYSEQTLTFLASRYNWDISRPSERVTLWRKIIC